MSSNIYQQSSASFHSRRSLHVHTKVVYRSCACFLAHCAEPGIHCHEFIATGMLLTGDVLIEGEEDLCPTCTRKFNEWVSVETEPEPSVESVSSSSSAFDADDDTTSEEAWESVEGESMEAEVLIEEEGGDDEDQALFGGVIVDECDPVMDPTFYDEDTHPLLLNFSTEEYLTDEMLENGPCPIPRPQSPSFEITPEEGDRIRAELNAALDDALEKCRP